MTWSVKTQLTGTVGELSAPIWFMYDRTDPYAVTLDCTDFNIAAGEPYNGSVTWVFARRILVPGNRADEDTADVQDVKGTWDGEHFTLRLASLDGSATIRFSPPALLAFLRQTQAVVPYGRESRYHAAAVDEACERLLGGASW